MIPHLLNSPRYPPPKNYIFVPTTGLAHPIFSTIPDFRWEKQPPSVGSFQGGAKFDLRALVGFGGRRGPGGLAVSTS